MSKIKYIIIIILAGFILSSCSDKLERKPVALSVRQNLALLQKDPQFVMYFNFKKMRDTDFWENFISDSLFNAERTFGNFLYTLKKATGVSITEGIDELYYSNTWFGDNAMVVKGTFDRKKIDDYTKTDTLYKVFVHQKGPVIYNDTEKHFYFYFKDDFTVCASNYLVQLEASMDVVVSDTVTAGLLWNKEAMDAIEMIKYKENLWMMSNQKLFIRGIFENLLNMNNPGGKTDSLSTPDTTSNNEGPLDVQALYEKVKAISFSVKMTDDITIVMQNECESEAAATEMKNRIEGITALFKISAGLSNKTPPSIMQMLDKMEFSNHDFTFLIEMKLDENTIREIRKQKVF
jgi:hypothetical protein